MILQAMLDTFTSDPVRLRGTADQLWFAPVLDGDNEFGLKAAELGAALRALGIEAADLWPTPTT